MLKFFNPNFECLIHLRLDQPEAVIILFVLFVLSLRLLELLLHHECLVGDLRLVHEREEQIPHLLYREHPRHQQLILDVALVLENALLLEPGRLLFYFIQLSLVFDNRARHIKLAALLY